MSEYESGQAAPGPSDPRQRDGSLKLRGFMIGWGLPILAAISPNFIPMTRTAAVLIMSGAFAWMGVGCVLNALHCRRRHCYFSGPALLAGAALLLLVGFKAIDIGQDGIPYVTYGTFALVLLTFVPEFIWGRYR